MHSREMISRNELSSRSKVPADVITFWIRYGLIVPDAKRVGRGGGQRFAYYEANIAAILREFRDFGCNVDTLLGFGTIYREAIAWGQKLGLSFEQTIALQFHMTAVLKYGRGVKANEDDAFEEYQLDVKALKSSSYFPLSDELIDIAMDMDQAEFTKHSDAFAEIMVQPINRPLPEPTYFWRADGRWKRSGGKKGQLRASGDGAFATFAMDAIGILYDVWNDKEEEDSPPETDPEPEPDPYFGAVR